MVLVAALSGCWDWYLTQELSAKSSGANLPQNGPNTPMSADLLRMHYYRGGHRTRGRHDRLGLRSIGIFCVGIGIVSEPSALLSV